MFVSPSAMLRFLPLLIFVASTTWQSPAHAQNGVIIDADGVLRIHRWRDPTGRLHRARVMAARAALDQDIQVASKLRKISINRLEAALATALAENRGPTEAMRNLAGLTRVQYIFYYPETKDIVLAGPAEGWVKDQSGRVVGIHSRRPVIGLEDLIVALRICALAEEKAPLISVSIDPTKEGLVRMQKFLAGLRNIRPSDDRRIAAGLRKSLGKQNVAVRGIPADSNFARILVEADYRMKLIGIGLEKPPVRITTYISKARPGAANAMHRWYFVPNYESVRLSDDGHAMEMVGQGVKLVGVQEVVAAGGQRQAAGRQDRASQLFCKSFTDKYAQLASKDPVYAQLRNCIDLCIAAAHIRQQGLHKAAEWEMGVFADEARYAVETHIAPRQVESAVNVVWKGNVLSTPIGGGVRIEPYKALSEGNLLTDKIEAVEKARQAIEPAKLPKNSWWWD